MEMAMKFDQKRPPRRFEVGADNKVTLSHCGTVHLEPDELVTLVTAAGNEYDVTRKTWGFYATPSLNYRLLQHALRAVLVKSQTNRFFLLLVEEGKEASFEEYLAGERLQIVCWMDTTENLQRLAEATGQAARGASLPCPICGSADSTTVFTYTQPPKGEIIAQPKDKAYYREIIRCGLCQHFRSTQALDPATLYSGAYVSSNYKDLSGIRAAFEKIIALDPDKSDNAGRVRRVLDFACHLFSDDGRPHSVLDVGSGLGVFPYAMKKAGWACTAVDPDERAVRHAREVIGVSAVCADFNSSENLGLFDVITFNRVLEHVEDPVTMLRKGQRNLNPGGFIYVEVPDGEMAAGEGKEREEFFVDHLHVFSLSSLSLAALGAGFTVSGLTRGREPSGKYSLWAFLKTTEKGFVDHG
jgi:SAM-dependent methyltransferase